MDYTNQETPRPVSMFRSLMPGLASDHIHHLSELIAHMGVVPVVLYCRESSRKQVRNGNLDEQITDTMEELASMGIRPIAIFDTYRSESAGMEDDRLMLEAAIFHARSFGAIVVAGSRDRFIRRGGCHRKSLASESECPTTTEYRQLIALAGDVPLATIYHPDTDPGDVRSNQTKRGQRAKNRKGGRPPKERQMKPRCTYREGLARMSEVKRLTDDGLSRRKVAERIGIATNQVQRYVDRLYCKE